MLKAAVKKLIMLFTAALFCLSAFSVLSLQSFAADGITMRLEKLKKDFPQGWYYNHKVKSASDNTVSLLEHRVEKYYRTVSRYPCVDHNGSAEKGAYDCNYFDGGYQCHGFASMLFYEIFGVRQSELEKNKKSPFKIKAGDLVRLNKDTHSAVVLSVKGEKFTVAECNVGENGDEPSCKISWGRSYKLSDITYYIRSDNYSKISKDTDWKNIESKYNAGSSFYGAIYSSSGKAALTLTDKSSVTFKKYTGSASQVWSFTRQKNGSYKIISCKNGKALSLVTDKNGKLKVNVSASGSSKGQLWAFYESSGKYLLSPDSSSYVLCSDSKGNACAAARALSSDRHFSLEKKKAPVASQVKAKGANGYVNLSWSKGKYTKSFDIEIYNASSKLYKKIEKLTSASLKLSLPAGNYSAKIISKNAYSQTQGNTVYFTVGKKGVLGKTAKVTAKYTSTTVTLSWTPVPDADGYAIYLKQNGSWKKLGKAEKTSFTVKKLTSGKKYSFAIRAYKLKKGKSSLAKAYTTFTAATKPKAVSKLTATQTSGSVTLKWSAMKQADGYTVYRKTSSGWKKLKSTTKSTLTVKSLSSGKSYTFGVSAYIKTDVGTVTGEIKSLSTATAPKAPELTLKNVKKLKAEIRWNRVSGADGYQVHYKLKGEDGYTHLADYKANEGGVQLSGLKKGAVYTFSVRAFKKSGSKRIYGAKTTVSFTAIN